MTNIKDLAKSEKDIHTFIGNKNITTNACAIQAND